MRKQDRGKVVIFAEDEETVRELCRILSEDGFEVSGHLSFESVIGVYRKDGFELCLADVDALHSDCIRFLEIAAQEGFGSEVILITRQKRISLIIEAMKIGIFDYLLKPFSREVLHLTISRAMEIQQMKRVHDIYAAAFQHSVEGIYLAAPDGSFIRVNDVLARMVGYRNPEDFIRHVPSLRSGFYVDTSRYEERMRLLRGSDLLSGFDSMVYCRDDAVIWISENIRSVRDEDGTVLFSRGAVSEFTQKKRGTCAVKECAEESHVYGEDCMHTADILLEIIDDLCVSHNGMRESFLGFAGTITDAIERKTPLARGHSERVASYAVCLAREIGCGKEEQEQVHNAAIVHDIGKVCIFDSILGKPGRLTHGEYEIMKRHPVHGAGILKKVPCLEEVVPPVMYHHERIDGKGYPEGLKGDEIPLHARILHVADSFDAMTASRPYREAPGKEYAFAELKRHIGSQFDRDVVEAAFRVL